MIDPVQILSRSLCVTLEKIHLYGQLTRDANPIHYDRQFASQTEMKGIIAQGTLGLNVLWASLEATFGDEMVSLGALDVRFIRPVRENDILTATGRLEAPNASRYEVQVLNQRNEAVIQGSFTPGESCSS